MSDQKEAIKVFSYDPKKCKEESNEEKESKEEKIVHNQLSLAFETFNKKFVESKSNQSSNSSKKFESPRERIQRLKHEIDDITKQLEALSSEDAIQDIASGSVSKDIDNLEMDFGAILNDTRISPYLPNDAPFPKSTLRRPDSELANGIIAQLSSLGGKGVNGASYQLFHRSKKGDQQHRLNELDHRLRAIEKKVGTIGEHMGFKSMNKALGDLYAKLKLLQGSNIDSLTRRIASMNAELILLKRQASGAKGGEKNINELHNLMQKKNASIKGLPSIVAKLQAKDSDHKKQADAVLRRQKLERIQIGLTSILKEDKEALTKVRQNMTENVKVMKSNIENFQNRFAALEQKLDQL